MLKLAKKKTGFHHERLNLLLGDLEFLPFRDNVFGSLLCVSTLHYLSSPRLAFTEFSRVLKRGGVLVYGDVTIHEMDADCFMDRLEKTISPAHGKYCKASEVKKLLEKCGIYVNETKTIPYRKSYASLIEDQAVYFGIKPQCVYRFIGDSLC